MGNPDSVFRVIILILVVAGGGFSLGDEPSEGFDFEKLSALIKNENIQSIEALLPRLPKDMTSNYTLVYASRSNHESSTSAPRAILFGRDAKMILTFNGNKDQEHFFDLEVAQWKDGSNRVELRNIHFPDPQRNEKNVRISEPNPQRCTSCHGKNPGHIWDAYREWPGVYGSYDDRLKNDELENYVAFSRIAGQHPRYKFLRPGHEESGVRMPYHTSLDNRTISNMPNSRLTSLISRYHAKALFERIKDSPKYDKYKYLLAIIINRCPNRVFTEADLKGAIESLRKDFGKELPEIKSLSRGYLGLLSPALFQVLGISEKEWTTEFDKARKTGWEDISVRSYNTGSADLDTFVNGLLMADLGRESNPIADWYKAHRSFVASEYKDSALFDATTSTLLDKIGTSVKGYAGSGDENLCYYVMEKFKTAPEKNPFGIPSSERKKPSTAAESPETHK